MEDEADGGTRRRQSRGLWRLLPFAGLLLVLIGAFSYASEPHGADPDAGRMIVLALVLAAFFSVYGPEGQARLEAAGAVREKRAARSTGVGLAAGLAFALAAAILLVSRTMPHLHAPASGIDWMLAACAVAAVSLYARSLHGLWAGRRTYESGSDLEEGEKRLRDPDPE